MAPIAPGETVYEERRKRGFFGWVFLLIFLAAQALMLAWCTTASIDVGNQSARVMTDAERAGLNIGAGVGFAFLFIVWAAVTIITGAFVLLTRGRKVVVTRRQG
jgi:hypothetical protein